MSGQSREAARDVCDMHERLATLAHNLAIGAGLCRAFRLGVLAYMPWSDGAFWPGCGKAAP